MNLRHAAALALVGWYMMVPPFAALNETRLSHWDLISSFDTAVECQSAVRAVAKRANDPKFMAEEAKTLKAQGFDLKAGNRRFAAARCISTDDPRLKN